MSQKLKGVSETLLIPLWVRAAETKREDAIIRDPKAVEILEKLDYDFTKLSTAWKSQVGISIRTKILDELVLNFIQQFPKSTIVNLGAGLDARFERIDNGHIQWYDLDQPEVIDLKQQFFQETERYHFIARSVLDFSWIEAIKEPSGPVLFIAEGLLMYLNPTQVYSILEQLITHFPDSQLAFETVSALLIGKSWFVDSVSKMQKPIPKFLWGITNSKTLESWNSQVSVLEEWDTFSLYPKRWRWVYFFVKRRLIKKYIGHRIVHLQFKASS